MGFLFSCATSQGVSIYFTGMVVVHSSAAVPRGETRGRMSHALVSVNGLAHSLTKFWCGAHLQLVRAEA